MREASAVGAGALGRVSVEGEVGGSGVDVLVAQHDCMREESRNRKEEEGEGAEHAVEEIGAAAAADADCGGKVGYH